MSAVMSTKTVGKKYHVRIIRREFQQSSDDYHATVMRLKDGVELVWISTWMWVLKFKIRRGAFDRTFEYYDKRKIKGKQVEEFCA